MSTKRDDIKGTITKKELLASHMHQEQWEGKRLCYKHV